MWLSQRISSVCLKPAPANKHISDAAHCGKPLSAAHQTHATKAKYGYQFTMVNTVTTTIFITAFIVAIIIKHVLVTTVIKLTDWMHHILILVAQAWIMITMVHFSLLHKVSSDCLSSILTITVILQRYISKNNNNNMVLPSYMCRNMVLLALSCYCLKWMCVWDQKMHK